MRFIENFDQWWRDVGQFVPPCDSAQRADREMFKAFAQNISKDTEGCLKEIESENTKLSTQVEALELNVSDAFKKLESARADLLEILDDESVSCLDKIKKLKELYENQA